MYLQQVWTYICINDCKLCFVIVIIVVWPKTHLLSFIQTVSVPCHSTPTFLFSIPKLCSNYILHLLFSFPTRKAKYHTFDCPLPQLMFYLVLFTNVIKTDYFHCYIHNTLVDTAMLISTMIISYIFRLKQSVCSQTAWNYSEN